MSSKRWFSLEKHLQSAWKPTHKIACGDKNKSPSRQRLPKIWRISYFYLWNHELSANSFENSSMSPTHLHVSRPFWWEKKTKSPGRHKWITTVISSSAIKRCIQDFGLFRDFPCFTPLGNKGEADFLVYFYYWKTIFAGNDRRAFVQECQKKLMCVRSFVTLNLDHILWVYALSKVVKYKKARK